MYNLRSILILISLLFLFCISSQVTTVTGLDNAGRNVQKFNFVTAGDFGCGDEPNRTIEGMKKKDPEIVIALGDLSYDKSAACWLNSIIPLDTSGRIKKTFGDHDLTKKMFKYSDYLQHFNMTRPFYSFNYANVHFLAMATAKNSIIPYQKGSEQYNFIQQDLRNASNNKSIDWIIVYTFRPFYSSGTEHSGQEDLPDIFHPLFDMYGVDIVLQAHSHNYQRTFPLMYNANSFSPLYHPTIGDKQRTEYKDSKGTIFLTVGTAGAELHNFTGKHSYIVEQFQTHGFLNVDITSSDNELKMFGTFYENTNMSKEDHFSISKKKILDDQK